MTDQAIRFGPSKALVGVVHRPSNPARTRSVGVVMLSAGVIHRAGPNRLHTSLAIRLASHGFTVLRFDFSGIGDSDVNPGTLGLPDRNVAETQDAMNVLSESYGIDEFILFGLCSGADNAFRAAAADPRVVGLGMLDGYAYHTSESIKRPTGHSPLRAGLSKLHDAAQWLRQFSVGGTGSKAGEIGLMLKPSRDDAERGVVRLLDRDVRLLCVYTPEFGVYRYADQFFDFFPAVGSHQNVRVEFFVHADHIFTENRYQTALSDLVSAWVMETVE